MRVPYMGGDFPFPIKYGYSLVGTVEQGPSHLLGTVVHLLHPHQDVCLVDATDVFPVPDGIPPSRAHWQATWRRPSRHLGRATGVGRRVLIVGFGHIGALIGQVLRACRESICGIVESDEGRQELAEARLPWRPAERRSSIWRFIPAARRRDCRRPSTASAWKAAWWKSAGMEPRRRRFDSAAPSQPAQNYYRQPGVTRRPLQTPRWDRVLPQAVGVLPAARSGVRPPAE